MATIIEDVLGYRNLTGIAKDIVGGVPDDILPSQFLAVNSRIEGHTGSYKRVSATRQTARTVNYGSAAIRRDQVGVTEVPFKALHTFEEQHHNMSTLMQLERMDSPEHQKLGQQEIARQTGEFARRFRNLRMATVYSTLVNGAIYFDSDGNLLPNSTGADASRTVDFGVPANNKDQLNGIIGTTWATDSTDIAGDIKAIKETARKTSGYPIRYAFYGANIYEYIASNTALGNIINGTQPVSQAFAGGEIPDGFLGLKWRPANEAFFEDKDGTNRDFWGDDTIVFTGEPTPEWWEVVEGSFAVPTSVGISSSADSAVAGSMSTVYGAFSYAHPSMNPPGIAHFHGDTFLPLLKVPSSIFIADVTP